MYHYEKTKMYDFHVLHLSSLSYEICLMHINLYQKHKKKKDCIKEDWCLIWEIVFFYNCTPGCATENKNQVSLLFSIFYVFKCSISK